MRLKSPHPVRSTSTLPLSSIARKSFALRTLSTFGPDGGNLGLLWKILNTSFCTLDSEGVEQRKPREDLIVRPASITLLAV